MPLSMHHEFINCEVISYTTVIITQFKTIHTKLLTFLENLTGHVIIIFCAFHKHTSVPKEHKKSILLVVIKTMGGSNNP